jgi:single-stranded DNA-binding protein
MSTEIGLVDNNKVYLVGRVLSAPVFSHEIFDEKFFEFDIEVPRLSDMKDILPITVSDKLLKSVNLGIGETVAINGQFRSYNKIVEDRSRLMLTVFVREFVDNVDNNPNQIDLKGYICKPPIYRTTPFSREICDMLIAVNRSYKKSDYIPCIAWGRNARLVKDIVVGQKLHVLGRIQSREYIKKISDIQSITKVAYEVSINKIDVDESKQHVSKLTLMQQSRQGMSDAAFASDIDLTTNTDVE